MGWFGFGCKSSGLGRLFPVLTRLTIHEDGKFLVKPGPKVDKVE